MNHSLETVKLKLRAYNTHRGRLEDVFKELESFEKELGEKAYVYCDACQEGKSYLESVENDNRCPDCESIVSEPLIELKGILGKKEQMKNV